MTNLSAEALLRAQYKKEMLVRLHVSVNGFVRPVVYLALLGMLDAKAANG